MSIKSYRLIATNREETIFSCRIIDCQMQIEKTIATFRIREGVFIYSTCVDGIPIENYKLIFTNRSETIFFRRIIDCQMQVDETITAFIICESIFVYSTCVDGIPIKYYRLIFTNSSKAIFFRGVIYSQIQN